MNQWFKIAEWHLILAATCFMFFTGLRDDLVKWKPLTLTIMESIPLLMIVWMAQLKVVSLGGLLDIYEIPTLGGYFLSFIIIYITVRLANRLDQLDGLLAPIAGFTFLIFGLASALLNLHGYAILCFGMVGSLFGYFKFQSAKCKIVIGKNGCLLIGFLLGFMSLYLFNVAIMKQDHGYGGFRNLLINIPVTLSFLLFPLFYYLRRMILFVFFRIPWNHNIGFQQLLLEKGIKKSLIPYLLVMVQAVLIGLVIIFVYLHIGINLILGILFLFSLLVIWLIGYGLSKTKFKDRIKINL
ncbi:hypothetical protein FSB73_22130 [Arachidicoccus ginsenosidivorans]|uniref:Uncharacterized protein n=1 Tax=Arachidicoccus ginsenosidivorans TaxID=496057 RepID=A0A5B8VTP9_9BACT|nr:hypothetical protein [Arachidicoccus ginsenosidivorans]QEC73965.1 hypothetical protein FSB73_22130 [Arachidicoccus ginsenosidivorans]